MYACAVEVIAGGLGGICLTAVATWYLLTHHRSPKVPDDPSTP